VRFQPSRTPSLTISRVVASDSQSHHLVHSARSVRTGSTRVARYAGSKLATVLTSTTTRATAKNVSVSCFVMPKTNIDSTSPSATDAMIPIARPTLVGFQPFDEHEANHIETRGPKRHPDANLVDALPHRVGQQPRCRRPPATGPAPQTR
jgi:hypothetical protein